MTNNNNGFSSDTAAEQAYQRNGLAQQLDRALSVAHMSDTELQIPAGMVDRIVAVTTPQLKSVRRPVLARIGFPVSSAIAASWLLLFGVAWWSLIEPETKPAMATANSTTQRASADLSGIKAEIGAWIQASDRKASLDREIAALKQTIEQQASHPGVKWDSDTESLNQAIRMELGEPMAF